MIRGFPHKDKVDDSYFATIAEILVRYPRSVALKCSHPVDGVLKQAGSFLPSVGLVVDWCENATRTLRENAASESRVTAQLQAREEWESNSRKPKQDISKWITYEEHLNAAAEGRTALRPVGASEPGGYLGPASISNI